MRVCTSWRFFGWIPQLYIPPRPLPLVLLEALTNLPNTFTLPLRLFVQELVSA